MGFTQPGAPGAPGTNGTFDTSFQGAWSAGTYTVGETVSHGGFLWVVLSASTTEEPVANSANWSKIAQSHLSGNVSWTSSAGFFLNAGAADASNSIYPGMFQLSGGAGDADGYGYANGGPLYIYGGGGAAGVAFYGGNGGSLSVFGGNGGGAVAASMNGGSGGSFSAVGGLGGTASGATSQSGAGGNGNIAGGGGGDASGAGRTAGAGGAAQVLGGNAGQATSGATAAAGGNARLDAGTGTPNGNVNIGNTNAINVNIGRSGGKIGFFGATAIVKPTVSGARNNPEAALADLITELANLGLITNSTTAS